MLVNGNDLLGGTEVVFGSVDIYLEIRLKAKSKEVTITTNMPNLDVADIKVSVNNGSVIQVNKALSLGLINGDVLTIYVKEKTGFKFDEKYYYSFGNVAITDLTNVDNVKVFSLFVDEGFDLTKSGTYTLIFTQIPFEVEFKYYLTTEERYLDTTEQPTGYMAESYIEIGDMKSGVMQLGSTVTLTQGVDKVGYRFDGYTYLSHKGNENAIDLGLTDLENGKQTFVVTPSIVAHLSNEQVVDGVIPVVIYVNYVRQYTFDISATDSIVKILKDDEEIDYTKYYDYGTVFKVSVKAEDSEHYQIAASINEDAVDNENQSKVETPIKTNLGNLSGFTTQEYILTQNCKVEASVIAERYGIQLNHYWEESNQEGYRGDDLTEVSNEWILLSGNVYYKTTGSFKYQEEVEIQIFVADAKFDGNRYYVLDTVNGQSVDTESGISDEVEGKDGLTYTINQTIQGTLLNPDEESITTSILDVCFKELYYVTLQ